MTKKIFYIESENRLLGKLNEEHKSIYKHLRGNFERYLLDFMATYIRYFTSHGKQHSEGIIMQVSNMLPESVLKTFSSSEMLVLLASIWLHDIGLLVNRDPITGYELDDKEIRERHHELSETMINKFHKELHIEDPVMASLIGRVVFCHRKKETIKKVFRKDSFVMANDRIRPRFVAALLRLGDALDSDWQRAPELIMDGLTSLPDESYLHWVACKIISIGYSYNKKTNAENAIHVTGTISITLDKDLSSSSIEDIFYWKLNDIRLEFSGVKEILYENDLRYHGVKGILMPRNKMTAVDEEINVEVKDIDVIIWERELTLHKNKKNFIFAADACYRIASFYTKKAGDNKYDKKEKENYSNKSCEFFTKAYENVLQAKREDKKKEFLYGLYYYNFLEKYFRLKSDVKNVKSGKHEELFLAHGDKTMGSFDYLEDNSIIMDSFDYLIVMLKAGRSPLRTKIKKALDAHYSKIKIEKNDKDDRKLASVHDGCCMCTAELLLEFKLSGRDGEKDIKENIENCKEWLGDQGQYDWMNHSGGSKSILYTAYVLDTYMSMNDKLKADEVFKSMLKINNLEDHVYSSDKYEFFGQIFRHVSRYINSITDVDKRKEYLKTFINKSNYQEIFISYLKELGVNESYDIINMVNYMLIDGAGDFYRDFYKECQSRKGCEELKNFFEDKDNIKPEDTMAFKAIKKLSENDMWKNGSWAYNPRKTLFSARCLIDFWEYYLYLDNKEEVLKSEDGKEKKEESKESLKTALEEYYDFCSHEKNSNSEDQESK